MEQSRADRLMGRALWASACLVLYWVCCALGRGAAAALGSFAGPAGQRLHWGGLLAATLAAALPVLALALGSGQLTRRSAGLGLPCKRGWGWFAGAYLLLAVPLSHLAGQLPGRTAALPQDSIALALAFGQLCAASALSEELVFRGVVQGLLRPFGAAAAVGVQAVLFAAMHGSAAQAAFALPMGLLFGCAAEYSGSLWVSAGLHFINNLLVFAGLWAYSRA